MSDDDTKLGERADRVGLMGATVVAVYVIDDDLVIVETDVGTLDLSVDGDCCSESWIWHVNGVTNVIGKEITGMGAVEMPDPTDGYSRQESDMAFGFRVHTTGGVLDVEARNSSNGYYGGIFSFTRGQGVPENAIKLTGDYDCGEVKKPVTDESNRDPF